MPHIDLKISSDITEIVKQKLAKQFEQDLVEIAGKDPGQISISIEEVDPKDWKKQVYDREIKPKLDRLYKKPEYKL